MHTVYNCKSTVSSISLQFYTTYWHHFLSSPESLLPVIFMLITHTAYCSFISTITMHISDWRCHLLDETGSTIVPLTLNPLRPLTWLNQERVWKWLIKNWLNYDLLLISTHNILKLKDGVCISIFILLLSNLHFPLFRRYSCLYTIPPEFWATLSTAALKKALWPPDVN